ncbi:MAG TPA: right-handed parallel beta-helix repeat-containing protein [Thermotogota bacterium]|nr:right-handed parallel beta-helix repeat-containing protein [Thermotogota bacterium]
MKKLIVVLMILGIIPFAFATTLEVGSTGSSYTTINQAILAASDGDVIRIHSGTYTENLRFSKSITLEGVTVNEVVVKPRISTSPTIMVENCNRLNIRNLTLYGESIALSLAMTNAVINNNKIITTNDGIRAGTLNHEISILNNSINGNYSSVRNKNSTGIMLVGIGKAIIENNAVTSFGTGLYLGGKDPVKISENQILSNNIGLYIAGNSNAIVYKNRIHKNVYCGLMIVSKPIVSVESNLFSSNLQYDLILSNRNCGDFLIDFTGKLRGNDNIFSEKIKMCPEDFVLEDDFIKDEE